MARDTTELLAAVRRAAFLPDASDQSSTDLLAFASQEIDTLVSEAIVAGRGEHWYATESTAIVPGALRYRLPRRAIARSVRAVTVVAPQSSTPEYGLSQVDPIDLRGLFSSGSVANPAYFAVEGEFLNLGAVPAESGWTLRVHYIRKPSQLVERSTTTMARIAAADSPTQLTFYSSDAATLASFGKFSYFDVVRGVEPYDVLYEDLFSSSNYTNPGPTITLYSGRPVVVADFTIDVFPEFGAGGSREANWWFPRDTTIFPQVPSAFWTAIVYATAAAALAATRDPGAVQMSARAAAAKTQAMNLMEPRDQRQTETIINPHSGLRNRHGRRWRR